MTKTIWILAITTLIVVGSVLNGRSAYAQPGGQNGGSPVASAIDRLTDVVSATAIQGPQGPTGPQGPRGDTGPASSLTTYTVVVSVQVTDNGFGRARPQCDFGDVSTGGGYSLPSQMFVRGTGPINSDNELVEDGESATGWEVFVRNDLGSLSEFRGFAVCADVPQ